MMSLSEKGRFQPPPKLQGAAQVVSETLASWPGVLARTHWLLGDESVVDGADFYADERELGHLHLDGSAHIAVGLALRKAILKAGLARPFRWSDQFIVFPLERPDQVADALWLFRLNYDRLHGTAMPDLLLRIEQHSAAARHLAAVH